MNWNLHLKGIMGLIGLALPLWSGAQAVTTPQNQVSAQYLERLSVLSGVSTASHPALRNMDRTELMAFLLETGINGEKTKLDREYLLRDNLLWRTDTVSTPRKGIRRLFYTDPASLFQLKTPDFRLKVNPMLQVEAGQERGDPELLFVNRRGVEIQGDIDQKVWFYTNVVEQQVRFPDYVNGRIAQFGAVPGAGFYKRYSSSIFNIDNGYDYNIATAYIGFKAGKHVRFQFGHGQQLIGNGYRSLILSDFGNNSLFLKANYRFGRWEYQNLFLELSPYSANNNPGAGDDLLQKKYAALHYLSLKATPRLSFGIMEGTMLRHSESFKAQYLNPILGYRSVENTHKTLLGLNAQWDLFRRIRLYGQLVFDGLDQRPAEKGWWGNRYALQTGMKYFNVFGINHLDAQLEYNLARPYMYADSTLSGAWAHYRHPLAHPLGGNFRELCGFVRYQPARRWFLNARVLYMKTADDVPGISQGSNVLVSTDLRSGDMDQIIGQGISANTLLAGAEVSYMIFHNCFLDVSVLFRDKQSTLQILSNTTTTFNAGIRLNFWKAGMDF